MSLLVSLDRARAWAEDPAATAVTAIAKGATTTVTAAGHGLAAGQEAVVSGALGMTAINLVPATVIAVPDADTVVLALDSSAFANYTGGGQIEDAATLRLVAGASAAIEQWCNRRFAAAERTEIFDGRGDTWLRPGEGPILSIASLSIDGAAISPITGDAAGWYLDSGRGRILLRGLLFSRGVQNIALTYTAGFDPIPEDVQTACLELAQHRRAERTSRGVQSESLAGQSITWGARAMPWSVEKALDSYRRVRL